MIGRLPLLLGLFTLTSSLFADSENLDSEAGELFALIGKRLSYMEEVARFKMAKNIPIEDMEREEAVLEAAKKRAEKAGLNPSSIEAFFKAQMAAAKGIQIRFQAEWTIDEALPVEPSMDLNSEIRPALTKLGNEIIDAIKAYLDGGKEFEPSLHPEFSDALRIRHLSAVHKRLIFSALQDIKTSSAD